MKYLFALLMSFAVIAPTFAADKAEEKPKMMLAKKKDHSKDKPAAKKTEKADAKKK